MTGVAAQMRSFLLDTAIRPDAQWRHDLPDGFDHWPSTLRQRIEVTDLGDHALRLWAASDCVRAVPAGGDVRALCAELTALAGGWAFAFDEASAAIVVVAGGVVAVDDEAGLTSWLDAVVLSAWHAWTVADALAAAVGGQASVSAPLGAAGPRTAVDGLLRLPESLRARPEWVFDPEQLRLVELPGLADELEARLAPHVAVDEADHEGFVLGGVADGPAWPARLEVRLEDRPGLGHGIRIRAGGPCPDAEGIAAELTAMVLAGEADLAPAVWTADDGGLWLGTFAADFTVSRLLRAGDGSLAGIGSLAEGVWASAVAVSPFVGQRGDGKPHGSAGTQAGAALTIHARCWVPALTAVGQALRGLGPSGSDGRLLWLPEPDGEAVTHLATWGRLDPPGPALTSLLMVGGTGVEARLLVVIGRHPANPDYRVCAAIGEGGSLTQAVLDVARAELRYVPGFVDQTDAPAELRDAAAAGLIGAVADTAGAEDARTWWASAIDPENVLQHYLALPAAWDKALAGRVSPGS